MRILDLGAGPGGWSEGFKALGRTDVLGLEKEVNPCQTAELAGHVRLQGDMTLMDPRHVRDFMDEEVEGLVASPPCTTFSVNGLGEGRSLLGELQAAANLYRGTPMTHYQLLQIVKDPRTAMALEPLRYIQALMPDWVAMEQVPGILPLFETMALLIREWGFNCWTGLLNAEQHGVPQARTRAVFLASFDAIAIPPRPTHSRYYAHTPQRLDPGVLRWVTLGEALGWDRIPEDRIRNQSGLPLDPTWVARRPALTVVGRPLMRHPGQTSSGSNLSGASRNDGFDLTASEAGVLQSFRADYPWSGGKCSEHQQVGDAIPPLLAEAVLRQFV